jgi:hypothetical protein
VLGVRYAKGEPADLELVTGIHLEYALEPPAPQEPAHSVWHHNGQGPVKAAKRSMVEVIEVNVRDEDPINRSQQSGLNRGRPAEMPHPAPEHGVGDEPRAVNVDHDGAVSQPGEPAQSTSTRIEYRCAATVITPFG